MTLNSFDFSKDPLDLFTIELKKAVEKKISEPTAFSLSTVKSNGMPSVRTLLFKGLSQGGFSFYTNYNSDKARELESGKAAMLFFWAPLAQQIRIEGHVEKLTRPESEAYFSSRPRLSQIGAWASDQDQEIPNSEYLQTKVKEFEKKFSGQQIPCPPHWGGYRLVPSLIEFWFGQDGRLHDRFIFERTSALAESPVVWRRYMKSP